MRNYSIEDPILRELMDCPLPAKYRLPTQSDVSIKGIKQGLRMLADVSFKDSPAMSGIINLLNERLDQTAPRELPMFVNQFVRDDTGITVELIDKLRKQKSARSLPPRGTLSPCDLKDVLTKCPHVQLKSAQVIDVPSEIKQLIANLAQHEHEEWQLAIKRYFKSRRIYVNPHISIDKWCAPIVAAWILGNKKPHKVAPQTKLEGGSFQDFEKLSEPHKGKIVLMSILAEDRVARKLNARDRKGLRSYYNLIEKLSDLDFQRGIRWIRDAVTATCCPLDQDPTHMAEKMESQFSLAGLFEMEKSATKAQHGKQGLPLKIGATIVTRSLVGRTLKASSIGPTHVRRLRDRNALDDYSLTLMAEDQKAQRDIDPTAEIPALLKDLYTLSQEASTTSPVILALAAGKCAMALTAKESYLRLVVRHQIVLLMRWAIDFGEYVRLNRLTSDRIQQIGQASLDKELAEIQQCLPEVAARILPADEAAEYKLPAPKDLMVFPLINSVTMGLTKLAEAAFDDELERDDILKVVKLLMTDLERLGSDRFEQIQMVFAVVVEDLYGDNSAKSFWQSRESSAAKLVDAWMPFEQSEMVRKIIWNSFARHLPSVARSLAAK